MKTAALAGLPSGKLFATCLIKEFYRHIQMAKTLKAETYFYRPYHSWEKGRHLLGVGCAKTFSLRCFNRSSCLPSTISRVL
ncbi:hypothetical protein EZZ75_09080 [Neisseria meningitidis]|nr:hypothetical protein [Neisseria meningitidis]